MRLSPATPPRRGSRLARDLVPLLTVLAVLHAPALGAQDTTAERARALAVADSALLAITQGDMVRLTDLMLPEAVLFPTTTREGRVRYALRTRAEQRAASGMTGIVERGWGGEVRISGPVAMVWLPYDLYRDGAWSHCGVDVFTLVRHDGAWRIAALAWSAEQPPACSRHPEGPPQR